MMGILANSYGYFTINSSSRQIKVRFTANNNMNITQVRFYYRVIWPPEYFRGVVDIYEDGVLKATSVEAFSTSFTGNVWIAYNFSSPVPIVENKTYDIVLRPAHIVTGYYNEVAFITTYSSEFKRFITNTIDPNLLGTNVRCYYSTDGGSNWVEYDTNLFSFLIVDDTGMCYGNPYTHVGTRNVFGSNYVGQYIRITNKSKTINTINVIARRNGNPPDLVAEIVDITSNKLLASTSVPASSIPTTTAIVSIPIQTVDLNVGSEYRIYFKCANNGGDPSNYYTIYYPYISSEYIINLGITDTNIRLASWGMG